jgi:hypothetical protein
MVPAVWVEPGKDPKVTAATTGKKISAPIQTMSARKSSVRSRVFIWEEYKAWEEDETEIMRCEKWAGGASG